MKALKDQRFTLFAPQAMRFCSSPKRCRELTTLVLQVARGEQALLLTADNDFGELVFRNRERHYGVLLIRSVDRIPEQNGADALVAIGEYGSELLNQFFVLAEGVLRIRRTAR